MATEVEQDHRRLAPLARPDCFIDHRPNRVGGLRRRDGAFGPGELHRGVEHRPLRVGNRLDESVVGQSGDQRRHAVVAQAPGVDAVRHEPVAERVHLQQRRHPDGVAEVVGELAPGHGRAGRRLDRQESRLAAPGQSLAQERKRQPGKVAAAADATDHQIGHRPGPFHLLQRFLPDDRLVHQHVVEHAAQRVLGVVFASGIFDRLRDGDPQTARRFRIFRPDPLAGLGPIGGARHHLGAPDVHHALAVRLLLVADAHHVDHALEVEEFGRKRQGAAPLAGAGFGGQPPGALRLVVEGLGHRRVRLVRPGRAASLVLVIDPGRRLELALQADCPHQWRRAPQSQRLLDRQRDIDVALLGNLLLDQLHREERCQVLRTNRLPGRGMKRWAPRKREVRLDVVPASRHLALVELDPGRGLRRLNTHGLLPPVVPRF